MKAAFVRIMLILIFLALVANVVVTAIRGVSLISLSTVIRLGYGALVVGDLSICGAALYFTSKTIQKHERSSLEWLRRAFVVAAASIAVVALAPWFYWTRPRGMEDAAFVLLLFGISYSVFAYASYRDYLRAVGTRAGVESRRRRRKGKRVDSHEIGGEVSWEE